MVDLRRAAAPYSAVIARLRPGDPEYSRGSSDWADGPRRTGSPDQVGRWQRWGRDSIFSRH